MEALGYPRTWHTTCFLSGGCGQQVLAHTNGHGDFVLFDDLGWPWPIHSCYQDRFGGPARGSIDMGHTKIVSYNGQLHKPWDVITPVPATLGGQKRFHLLASITHVDRGFLNKVSQFKNLYGEALEEAKRIISGRTSLLTLVTGSGEEFAVLINLKETPCKFGDIVVADVKAVRLLSDAVFVVNRLRVFHHNN